METLTVRMLPEAVEQKIAAALSGPLPLFDTLRSISGEVSMMGRAGNGEFALASRRLYPNPFAMRLYGSIVADGARSKLSFDCAPSEEGPVLAALWGLGGAALVLLMAFGKVDFMPGNRDLIATAAIWAFGLVNIAGLFWLARRERGGLRAFVAALFKGATA